MNLFAISSLILISPLLIQIVVGSIIMSKKTKWNFDLLSIINIVLQVLFLFIAIKIVSIDAEKQNMRCGMPQVAIFFLGVLSTIALVIVIGIQIGIRKYRNRKVTE